MSGARWSLIATAAAAVMALSVRGQESQTLRDRDPDIEAAERVAAEVQQANFHAGPFYLWSRIRLGDAGFSTNLNVPTGESGGGVSLIVEAPQRLYFVPRKKTVFSLEATPAYTFLNEEGKSGQFDYSVRGDAHFLLNHLYLDVYAIGADRVRAHISEINRLATTKSQEYGAAGEFKYSSRTSATFALRRRTVSYPDSRYQPEDAPVDLLDRTEDVVRLAAHHKTFPRTTLFVAGEAGLYEFDRTSFKDSSRTSVGGGFLYERGGVDIRVEGASTRLQFDDATQHDYQGVTGSLALTREQGRWAYSLGGERDIGFAIFASNNYFEATRATAGISRRVGRSLTVRVNGVVERDEFPVPVLGFHRRDDISFYSAGFSYNIWKLDVGTDVGQYERKSTYGGDEDEGIRWLLHLSFTL